MDTKELIYNMFKNQAIKPKKFKKEIKEKFNLKDREIGDLYVRIVNYQSETFGGILLNTNFIATQEELYKRVDLAKARKKQKLHNYDKNSKHNRKYNYL